MTISDVSPLGARSSTGESLIQHEPVFTKDSLFFFLCAGKNVLVHSTGTASCVMKLKGHTDNVTGVAINPDNSLQIYTHSLDGTVCLWDYIDGVLLKTIEVGMPVIHMTVIPTTPDQAIVCTKRIATEKKESRLYLSRLSLKMPKEQGVVITTMSRLKGNVVGWNMSAEGSQLAVATSRNLYVVPLTTQDGTLCFTHPRGQLTCVAHHPTEKTIATGDSMGRITIWHDLDPTREPTTEVLHWHALGVNSLAFTGDGEYLVSGGNEAVLVIWQLKTQNKDFLPRLGAPIVSVAVSPDQNYYVTGHTDNAIRFINVRTSEVEKQLRGLVMSGSSLTLSSIPVHPYYHYIALPGMPAQLQLYDLLGDRHIADLAVGPHMFIGRKEEADASVIHVDHAVFAMQGQALVTAERKVSPGGQIENRVRFWAYNPDKQRYVQTTCADAAHGKPITGLAASPNEAIAVTTSLDGSFKIWARNDDKGKVSWWDCAATGAYRNLPARAVDFSTDGSLLAVAFDQVVTLWQPDTAMLVGTLDQGNQSQIVNKMVFVPNTPYLAVATTSDLIVWNLMMCTAWWSLPIQVAAMTPHPTNGTLAVGLARGLDQGQVVLMETKRPKFISIGLEERPIEGLVYVEGSLLVAVGGSFGCYGDGKAANEEEVETEGKKGRGDAYSVVFGPAGGKQPATRAILTVEPHVGIDASAQNVFAAPSHVLPPVSTLYDVFMERLLNGHKSAKGKYMDSDSDTEMVDEDKPQSNVQNATSHKGHFEARILKSKSLPEPDVPVIGRPQEEMDQLVSVFSSQLGASLMSESTPKSPRRPDNTPKRILAQAAKIAASPRWTPKKTNDTGDESGPSTPQSHSKKFMPASVAN